MKEIMLDINEKVLIKTPYGDIEIAPLNRSANSLTNNFIRINGHKLENSLELHPIACNMLDVRLFNSFYMKYEGDINE